MSENEGRVLACPQCNKPITWTNHDDIIAFCDEVCLNSYVCEQSAESKDEMLQAISYANNREDLEA